MQAQNYQIVTGIVIAISFFLLLGFFIVILVVYYNGRKKRFIQEKQILQATFNEQLLTSQLEIQEQTFNNISQEIHDNVGQILSLAKVQLNILEKRERLDGNRLLSDIKESIGKALIDLRDIAKSLSTDRIQTISLYEMINHELQRINRLGTIQAAIEISGTERQTTDSKKLILFRIIQESLHNILKHSGATKIGLTFFYHTEMLEINITDNGLGFDIKLIETGGGLGIQNIINRAKLVGGKATIKSAVNEGTSIKIIAPYA